MMDNGLEWVLAWYGSRHSRGTEWRAYKENVRRGGLKKDEG